MRFEENVVLAPFTTFHIGGPARYFARVRTVDELRTALASAEEKKLEIVVLGGGSNVLIADEGFPGCVIRMESAETAWNAHDSLHIEVVADAGVEWDTLVRASVARGLHGLENLSGIPGTVGAAPVQNIGAYGAELSDTCAWVEAFDTQTKEIIRFSAHECAFGYRDSIFKHERKHFIITRVAFLLPRSAPENISYKDLKEYFEHTGNPYPTLDEVRTAVLSIRALKFPDLRTIGTAGSFFKNPIIPRLKYDELRMAYPALPGFPTDDGQIKIALAWILDHVIHAKGMREGNAMAWNQQPLVIAADAGARAHDVMTLADRIAHAVKEATGIDIEREVRIIQGI